MGDKCICLDCKTVFDIMDIHWKREYVGEFWGMPAYDDFGYCPECGSDQIEDKEYAEQEEDV